MNFFDVILINPILNIMVAIYQLLYHINVPSALGFSIIVLTIVVRLISADASKSQAAKKDAAVDTAY